MRDVFADTAFYIALAAPREAAHAKAVRLANQMRVRTVTTDYVLIETANFFSRSGDKPVFLALLTAIRADPNTAVIPSGPDLLSRGLALYESRLDKDWSLTDCISFAVMHERALVDALTTDHHFGQAGFNVLLK